MSLIAVIPTICILFAGAFMLSSSGYAFDLRRQPRRGITGGRRKGDRAAI